MRKTILFLLLAMLAGCSNDHEVIETTEVARETGPSLQPSIETNEPVRIEEPFALFDLTIIEGENPYALPSTGILSVEEATEMIADYIWEVLGINISGKWLEITYVRPLGLTRSYWSAWVLEDQQALEQFQPSFRAMIDAYTGERIDIYNFYDTESRPWGYDSWPVPSIEESAYYKEVALGYAKRHFDFTEIETIDFHPDWAFNVAGTLTFFAIDERGRVADITIQLGTGRLMFLSTQNNDINQSFQTPAGGVG